MCSSDLHALMDSFAQTAVIETYKLYDRKRNTGSMHTVMRLLQSTALGLQISPPALNAPATVAALKELGKARHEIMAHANYQTDQASMRGVPLLQQVAEPFVMATKEQCLGEPPKVLYRGRPNVPFYDVGVMGAMQELEQLIEYANRGRT